jgi:TraM recognition site of TraD and TraG
MGFVAWLIGRLRIGDTQEPRTPIIERLGDVPLFQLSPVDVLTIEEGCQGILSLGGVGSGKTSGSGQAFARCLLRSRMGGLVCCAKSDEADLFRRYAAEEGRSDDLLVVSRDGLLTLNILDYVLRMSRGNVEEVVQIFLRALEVGGRSAKNSNEPFWEDALRQLLRNGLGLLALVPGELSLLELHELVLSAPTSLEEAQSPAWRETSACGLCLSLAEHETRDDPEQAHNVRRIAEYWLREFPTIPDRTRNSIVASFTAVTDPFLRNPMYRLFCTTTTVRPEDSFRGKIIVLDLSVKLEGFTGRYAQTLFKAVWQRAAERRRSDADAFPTFLFMDEAHYFITKSDQEFFTTARSARVISVLLSQTVSNFYAEFNGQKDAANAVLGTLNLKIFHANNDPETNEYASRVIGQTWQERVGFTRGTSAGLSPNSANESSSAQMNEQLAAQVLPHTFINLRTGGPRNGFVIEAIACRSGAPFAFSGKNFLRVEFSQTMD